MKSNQLLLLLLLPFSGCICKKQVYPITLPPQTTTGVGLIGFRYNNSYTWESISKKPFLFNTLQVDTTASARYFLTDSSLVISAMMYSKDYNNVVNASSQFGMILHQALPPTRTYIFGVNRNDNMASFSDNLSGKFYVNQANSFALSFTRFDTTARILSGQFSGTLYNSATAGDTLHITEGRFDVKY